MALPDNKSGTPPGDGTVRPSGLGVVRRGQPPPPAGSARGRARSQDHPPCRCRPPRRRATSSGGAGGSARPHPHPPCRCRPPRRRATSSGGAGGSARPHPHSPCRWHCFGAAPHRWGAGAAAPRTAASVQPTRGVGRQPTGATHRRAAQSARGPAGRWRASRRSLPTNPPEAGPCRRLRAQPGGHQGR